MLTVQDVRKMVEMDVQGMSYGQLVKYAQENYRIDTDADAMTYKEVVEAIVAAEQYAFVH